MAEKIPCTCEYAPGHVYELEPEHASLHAVTCRHSATKNEDPMRAALRLGHSADVAERQVLLAHLGALASIGNRIATALEGLVLHAGLVSASVEDVTAQMVMSERRAAARRKRKPKRKRRKPRGLAASLVSLVLLVGCGGVATTTELVEGSPVPLAEGGVVRVAERDAGDSGHPIECTPDAEAHTGILCMHPKRERRADGGAHP